MVALTRVLATADTELCADAVEWSPTHPSTVAVGTYQVLPSTDSSVTQRTGRLLLYTYSDTGLVPVHQQETQAILDIKWRHHQEEHGLLAVADAQGAICLYRVTQDHQVEEVSKWQYEQEALTLSLDWSNRVHPSVCRLAASHSDGGLSIVDVSNERLSTGLSISAHGHEAWITAFDYWNANTLYSGGDDVKMKQWDLRSPHAPVWTSKRHTAGVCSISTSHLDEHLFASGSYDESLFIWDKRQLKAPLQDIPLGGGVWRIKWHPSRPDTLVCACMHGGFKVIQTDGSSSRITQELQHTSLAYGVDWSYEGQQCLVGSCSFYDHTFKLWSID